MHSTEMLLKVVQPGPFLVRTRTISAKAEVHHLGSALWFFVVNALFVAGQVVDSTKAFFARTIGLVAFEEFSMASLMFSMPASQYW